MKRQLAVILLCLLAGVVINMLVAWTIAVSTDVVHLARQSARIGPPTRISVSIWSDGDAVTYLAQPWFHSVGRSVRAQTVDYVGYQGPPIGTPSFVLEGRYGWPMRSMTSWIPFMEALRGSKHSVYPGDRPRSPWLVGFRSPIDFGVGRTNPVISSRPLPIGFVVNSLLYGSLAWSVLFAPHALRRAHRRRRGRCLRCGYALEELMTCPECGSAT